MTSAWKMVVHTLNIFLLDRYDVMLSVQWSPPGLAAVFLIDSLGMSEDNKIAVRLNVLE